jgi:hypothetical protein
MYVAQYSIQYYLQFHVTVVGLGIYYHRSGDTPAVVIEIHEIT